MGTFRSSYQGYLACRRNEESEYVSLSDFEYMQGDPVEICAIDCLYTHEEIEDSLGDDYDRELYPGCDDGICNLELREFDAENWRFCPEDCPAVCGDGECWPIRGENEATCLVDCGVLECGDGRCLAAAGEQCRPCEESEENCIYCPEDCGENRELSCSDRLESCETSCPDDELKCGDGLCRVMPYSPPPFSTPLMEDDNFFEHPCNCPEDCVGPLACNTYCAEYPERCCGDGVCLFPENGIRCPEDCSCGDDYCDPLTEDASTCPGDCITCGDGICIGNCDSYSGCSPCDGNALDPEFISCASESPERMICHDDCSYCGDDRCDSDVNEGGLTCESDCGTCGNNSCDDDEDIENCPMDCDPSRIGECGDNTCDYEETYRLCPTDCDELCGNELCEWPSTHETCPVDCDPGCGDGIQNNNEDTFSCPIDSGPMNDHDRLCSRSLGEYSSECFCPPGSFNKGRYTYTCPDIFDDFSNPAYAYCGDGECMLDRGENCENCAQDCVKPDINGSFVCIAPCGDGICSDLLGEICAGCQSDCCPICGDDVCAQSELDFCISDCQNRCGNNICELRETCDTCPEDCCTCPDGSCSVQELISSSCPEDCDICGDGVCSFYEERNNNCSTDCSCGDGICSSRERINRSCPDDCGSSSCGNGYCSLNETPQSCPSDCFRIIPRSPWRFGRF